MPLNQTMPKVGFASSGHGPALLSMGEGAIDWSCSHLHTAYEDPPADRFNSRQGARVHLHWWRFHR